MKHINFAFTQHTSLKNRRRTFYALLCVGIVGTVLLVISLTQLYHLHTLQSAVALEQESSTLLKQKAEQATRLKEEVTQLEKKVIKFDADARHTKHALPLLDAVIQTPSKYIVIDRAAVKKNSISIQAHTDTIDHATAWVEHLKTNPCVHHATISNVHHAVEGTHAYTRFEVTMSTKWCKNTPR